MKIAIFLNNGNFLGIIKLFAEFDPFLHDYLEKSKLKKKSNAFVSKTDKGDLVKIKGERIK